MEGIRITDTIHISDLSSIGIEKKVNSSDVYKYKVEDGRTLIGVALNHMAHRGFAGKYAKTTIGKFLDFKPYGTHMDTEIPKNIQDYFNLMDASYKDPNFNVRCLLMDEKTKEVGLYDMYYVSHRKTYWDTTKFFVKVEQRDLPHICTNSAGITPYEKPYFLINDNMLYRASQEYKLNDVLRYTKRTSKDMVWNTLKNVENNLSAISEDLAKDTIQSVINLSKDWCDGYEDKADALNYYGFGIRSIEAIKEKDTEDIADLSEAFTDAINCYIEEPGVTYVYCPICHSVHDVQDALAKKMSLEGIMGFECEPISGSELWCCDMLLNYIRVCKKCGKAYMYRGDGYDANDTCTHCYEESREYMIKSYHDTPTMRYYDYDDDKKENFIDAGATAELWGGYGVELEVGNGGEKDSESEQVIKILNREVYTMHDGSIFNNDEDEDPEENGGFEIITFPHTDKALLNMNWAQAFKHLLKHNYRSHDIETCGLHMHISRTLFNDNDAIAKMMYFYEVNYDDVCNFARRSKSKAIRWASPYINGVANFTPTFVKEKVEYNLARYDKTRAHEMRYKCVNITNPKTIEVRIVRGTLNFATFMASLDFLIKISKKANEISWDDVLSNNIDKWFEDFDSGTIEYMKSRGCFNQPKQYAFPNTPEAKEARELCGGDARQATADEIQSTMDLWRQTIQTPPFIIADDNTDWYPF